MNTNKFLRKAFAGLMIASLIAGTYGPVEGTRIYAKSSKQSVKTSEMVGHDFDDLYSIVDKDPEKTEKVNKRLSKSGSVKKQSKAKTQTDDYNREVDNYISSTMDSQLSAALLGGTGTKAVVKAADSYGKSRGFKSMSTFTFKTSKLKNMGKISASSFLDYAMNAIGTKSNLCTLFTGGRISTGITNTTLTLYSVYEKNSQSTIIKSYKALLADIEKVPKQSTTMSESDILLYLHDRVVEEGEYAFAESRKKTGSGYDYSIHTPAAIAKTGKIVCQAYAAVMTVPV